MDTNARQPTKNTTAFFAQAAISFGVALIGITFAVLYMPGDPWMRAFFAMTTMFLTTSCFTLAKVVRDAQENQYVVSRIDQARVDKILADHDPWNNVA